MARVGAGRLLRKRHGPRRESYLELFFDLAFIVALMRLSGQVGGQGQGQAPTPDADLSPGS
jgi:low temperature requirement protein LtrA